jgi:hypothetical protein
MIKTIKKGLIFNLIAAAALLLTVLAAAGCTSATKIGDVMADNSKYEGKTITVKGTVGDTVWLQPPIKAPTRSVTAAGQSG